MEALSNLLQSNNIYFNFFSFANLLALVFTFLVGLFLVTLKNRSKSTVHLGMVFMAMAPFSLAYVFAHSYYDPAAAYHRWATVAIILVPLIHMAQWCFKYPENNYPIASRIVVGIQYLIAAIFTVVFVNLSTEVGTKFIFAGHHFDFNADEFSETFGLVIVLYMLWIVCLGIFKIIVTKNRERWTVAWITGAMVVSTIIPAILNVASRNGAMGRGTFATVFVLSTVIGYFVMVVIYINRTSDRTSFMAKIVGISLVTFLVMMQVISLFSLRDREREYDAFRVELSDRALAEGTRHEDIEYIVRYDVETGTADQIYMADAYDLDIDATKADLANTAVYEDIKALDDIDFASSLNGLLNNNPHPHFGGYRNAIADFVTQNQMELDGPELKQALLDELTTFNTQARVHEKKIARFPEEGFRVAFGDYLRSNNDSFTLAANEFMTDHPDMDDVTLKSEVLKIVAPMKPESERHFRSLANETKKIEQGVFRHFTAFTQYDREANAVYEVAFTYRAYRAFIHSSALQQKIVMLVVLAVLLIVFPLFFRGSLINPLNSLLRGVRKVNDGDLSVQVPIKVQDEIGFLATSFNGMVDSIREAQIKLQDYANNLEEKVKERTAELNETLEQVNALKVQQDGDYFLTSLLQKPLNYDANKSETTKTEIYLQQKKKFEFRKKQADLGGDICVTGNLRLGKPDDYRRYVVAMNGDAMGKSMQGAGGSLVMGVVMNSILARSAKNNRVLDTTPEQWLTDVYEEVHGVFLAFNGSMVISATMAVIDEQTGDMWYFNAEHPYQVLYRNGKASFIEEELLLRKIGLESEIPFKVQYIKLEPGDVVIMGSDGRDDLDTSPEEPIRTINEDEYLFLKRVEEADGRLDAIVQGLLDFGSLTDDLSLLRLAYQEAPVDQATEAPSEQPRAERVIIDIDLHDEREEVNTGDENFDELFRKGRELARDGHHDEALKFLNQAYDMRDNVPELNKIMAVLTFKGQDYERAVSILDQYLQQDSSLVDFWLYLSIAHKRTGNVDSALDAALKVEEMDPNRVINLINLGDLYQKAGDMDRAKSYVDKALELDPGNAQAKSLASALA